MEKEIKQNILSKKYSYTKTCSITILNIKRRFFKGYRLITNNGYCKHSNGSSLTQCYKRSVSSLSACEADCTASSSCIGYDYGSNNCFLVPTSQSFSMCPNGYNLNGIGVSGYTMAKTSDDLVESILPEGGHSCYAKNAGINE